ncbi:MAG: nicotinate-nucleotide adenylyltransferase [Flavobacteriaceae bacterium]|nr:nicotinate-nucleotide adenylyltransferase [Flavobacteriaceae bacterium]
MKKLVLVLFVLGLTSPIFAQNPIELSEVFITAKNYKYLSSVDNSEAPVSVKTLEREAAVFNAKEHSDLYVDNFNTYNVSFYIPDGKIVALYDGDGNIIKTIERFKNVQLPEDVQNSIRKRFPQWEVVKDVYEVKYTETKGAKKLYKVKLKNGNETIRVKIDEYGNYM